MADALDSTPTLNSRPASPLAGISRDRLSRAIERLIAVLDRLDADPDMEPDACAELSLQHEILGGACVRAA